MANATKYVDNVNGNNGNTGDSEAQAYADIATALAALTGGGNTIHVQAAGSNYTLTSSLALSLLGDTTNGPNRIEGYTTTPGGRDGRPTITSSTSGLAIFSCSNFADLEICHVKFTHTGTTRGRLFAEAVNPPWGGVAKSCLLEDVIIDGVLDVNAVAHPGGTWVLHGVQVVNTTATGPVLNGCFLNAFGCFFRGNAGVPWQSGGANVDAAVDYCVFAGNLRGIEDSSAGSARTVAIWVTNSTFYGHTGDGIKVDNAAGSPSYMIDNNVFYGNGGYGVNIVQAATVAKFRTRTNRNNAYGSNTSGARNNLPAGFGDVALTADPFVDATNGNLAPNSTAGGGAALRAAGFPGAFPGGTTTGYLDIGAAQHQDAGGGAKGARNVVIGGFSVA